VERTRRSPGGAHRESGTDWTVQDVSEPLQRSGSGRTETGQITVTAQATAEFFDTGSLEVSKTIDGPAPGQQGQVVIQVV